MPRARKPRIQDAPSTGYGDEAALVESVTQVPMGQQPMVGPDEVTDVSAPSERPNEPLTAGLAVGPGVGPEALGAMGETDPVRRMLQSMLVVAPNNDVMRLIDMLDIQGR